MLENFHLAAIVKERTQTRLLQIPLHQALQGSLAESWEDQKDRFLDGTEEINFDVGYSPEKHERFRVPDYEPPNWLADENSQTIENLDTIASHEELFDSITGTVAMARNDQDEELVLFQNFTRSRVIRPGGFLILEGNTYKSAERRGLTLDVDLNAVYQPTERKLLFRNFRTVNTFLPLAEFYRDVSEQEIREVLDHPLLAAEDPDESVASANEWFRKRIAMLKDSDLLYQFSAREIEKRSIGYDVSVVVAADKIVFPSDKLTAKRLLQFLNEELYRGAITETLYETNSKREAG